MNTVELAPYLQEPNYYRIRYQLAASLLNAEIERTGGRAEPVARTPGAFEAAARSVGVDGAATAAAAAQMLVTEAQAVLEKLDEAETVRARDHQSRSRRRHRDTPRGERTLRAFLERTLLPSAELVLASASDLAEGQGAGGTQYNRVRALMEADPHLSYRVYYNAACYLSTAAWMDEDAVAALADFQRSLRLAQGSERGQLAHWAQRDPSLARLRDKQSTAFTEAVNLALSSLPEVQTSAPGQPDPPKRRV